MANARQFMAARTAAWAKSGKGNPYQTADNALVLCYDAKYKLGTYVRFSATESVTIPFASYPEIFQSGMTAELCIDHTYQSINQVNFMPALGTGITFVTQPQWKRWFCRWSPYTFHDTGFDSDLAPGFRYAHTLAIGCSGGTISYQAKDGGLGYFYDTGNNYSTATVVDSAEFKLSYSRLSFRVYNRVLSQSELLDRWNIDKARFNLP